MTFFTEIEQETLDIDWFAVDRHERIGHFASGGFQLLPPIIAQNKENLGKLKNYFESLSVYSENHHKICSGYKRIYEQTKESNFSTDIKRVIQSFSEMSNKGLYSYDNPPGVINRAYFRVTVPKKELILNNLPEEIREILERLRINEVSFDQDFVISEQIISKL